jgi:hypothetical protein
MDELHVVVFRADVRSAGEHWVGSATYLAPLGRVTWDDFARQVAGDLRDEIINLIQPGEHFRFKIDGQSLTLTGPVAQLRRNRLNREAAGLSLRWEWDLINGVVYTTTTKGVSRGKVK